MKLLMKYIYAKLYLESCTASSLDQSILYSSDAYR